MSTREGVRSAGGIASIVVTLTVCALVVAPSFVPQVFRAAAAEAPAHGRGAAAATDGDTFQGLMDEAMARMHAGSGGRGSVSSSSLVPRCERSPGKRPARRSHPTFP
jgi:hypothetical protein